MRSFGSPVASGVLVAGALGALFLQLFVLPLADLPGWPLIPLVLTSTPLWSLVHESIHGSLLQDRPWNDCLGRALAIGYGAPFGLLKAGHLLHHRFSRTPRERTEVYDPAESTWAGRAPGYYLRLFGGLYLAEASSILLAFAPRSVWQRLGRKLDAPDTVTALLFESVAARRLAEFRLDALLIVLLYAAAFLAYGPHWWWLAAALAGRAVLVSVADNAYHYGTALDEPLEAMNLHLPRSLELFILAFNLHGVHHKHPGLAWHDLRSVFLAEGGHFDLDWFAAAGRQIRGPIPVTSRRLQKARPGRPAGPAARHRGDAPPAGGTTQPAEQTVPFRVNTVGGTFGPL